MVVYGAVVSFATGPVIGIVVRVSLVLYVR